MKALIQKIKRLLRDRKFRRLWSRTISVVAALVVFVTTYALVLPAITMEREAYCGIPAHQHTDACFEQRLICTTPESPGHHHDDACYATHQELVCQVEEHTHDPTVCYDEEGTLVCQLPEHVHDQTVCWKDVTELTCIVEESDGHQHSDACYENVLVCGMEVHTHSEECYHNPDEDAEANAVAAMQDGGDGTGAETPDEGAVFETYEDFAGDETYESSDPNGEEGLPADDGTGIPDDEPILNDEAFLNEEGLPGGEGLPSDEGMEGMAAGQEIEGVEDGLPADSEGITNGEDGMPEQGTDGNPDAALDEKGNPTESTQTGTDENGNPVAGTQTGLDENGNPILDPDAPQETAETADTAQAANGGQLDPAANTYVPNLAPIDFAAALNKRTGIYYYAVQEGETVEDSSSISGWKKIEKNTELGPNDLLRVYLAYTIPAGSLNKTNPTATYRLPANLRLTDAQVNAINAVENGIAAQYIDYNTLTLIDPDNYHRYLGAEAIEGTRKPDQDLNEYLKEHTADGGEAQEFISATVRVENVYGTESSSGDGDSLLCQNLIFTFSPYTIEKNQHTYDASGQPTRAGEKVRGWFTLDFNLAQVNLGEPRLEETADAAAANPVIAENAASGAAGAENPASVLEARLVRVIRTAEIVFVQEDQARGLEEISTQITVVTEEEMVNTGENSEVGNDYPAEPDEADENNENHENDENIEETAENEETEKTAVEGNNADEPEVNAAEAEAKKEKTDEEKEAELKEALASMMPAISFEDSIRVRTGKPAGVVEGDSGVAAANAAEALPRKAKVTVRVEADEGTFPVGTTMVLSAVEDLDAVAETVRDAVENGAAGEAPENGEATDAGSDHTTGNAEKTNPANAANASNNPKTYGFQAVDISFRDADGNEIEPAKPVRVALTSEIVEQIKKDKEADGATAIADPVVVHVDDKGNAEKMDLIAPEEIEPAQGRTEEEIREELVKAAAEAGELERQAEEPAAKQDDIEKETVERDNTEETTTSEEQERGDKAEEFDVPAEERQTQDSAPSGESSVFFETDSFSIYAIVYTVDFHWEVDGKMYEFSIPGGGFISLEHLVEVLGITGSEESQTTDTYACEESIKLNDAKVSEAAKKFVADVASVEFGSPELVDVSKADTDITVGQIKENRGLVCEYSADLTEEQIAKINAQTVETGDWALISLLPFTSEETLTVTMKDGEVFTICVTDYQISTNVLTADGKNYKITVTYDDDAKIPIGTKLAAEEIEAGTDDYLLLMGQTWLEINKDYFEVEELRKNYNESMGFLPEVNLINLDSGRYFDIKLIYKDEEIEPSAPVHVEIEYVDGLSIEDASTIGVAHFSDDGLEIIDEVDTKTKDSEVVYFSYDQKSFSDTGTFVSHETHDLGTTAAEELTNSFSVMAGLKAGNVLSGGGAGLAAVREGENTNDESEELAKPQANKTLVPNETIDGTEDGTYTLTLSVSGTSKKNSYSEVTKSNVVIVMDRSSSMTDNYTYVKYEGPHDSNLEYYGIVNGSYVALNYNNGRYTYTYRDNYWPYNSHTVEYTGTVYARKTRLAAEQDALASLIKQLTDKNMPGQTMIDEEGNTISLEDIIEVKIISFASGRTDQDKANGFKRNGKTVDTKGTNFTNTESGWGTTYSDGSTLKEAVIDNSVAKGTNWEEAMEYAREVADAKKAAQPDETVYVVFLTDGEPTDINGDNGNAQWYQDNEKCLKAAEPDAKAIVDPHTVFTSANEEVTTDHKFYGIFTYGDTDAMKNYLRRLVNYSYGKGDVGTEGISGGTGDYYFDADSTNALLNAFQQILSQVSNSTAYGKVMITDGLTTDAMTTTLVEGKAEGYKYTVTGQLGELYTVTAKSPQEGQTDPAVTFTVNGNNYQGVKKTAAIDGKTYTYWSCAVGEGDDAVEYKMTLADVDSNGQLTWDLTGIGTLMDGYTYSASFVVWPDQDAYDYVAGLNNGLPGYTWSQSASTYKDLTTTKGYEKGGVERFPSIVKYPNSVYAVLTNTEQKVQYSIVNTRVENGETTVLYDGPYDFDLPTPNPMPLTASSSQIEKVWNIDRDPDILAELLYGDPEHPYTIGFDILQDGNNTPYTSVGLGWDAEKQEYIWSTAEEDLIYVKWDSSQNKYVRCAKGDEGAKAIGTHWADDFSIATGLMLSENRMNALRLDKTAYAWTEYEGTKYYLLEEGHDYTIKEPDVGYEFDFEAPVYHPMLVDGVLRNVNLENIVKNNNGKVTSFGISGISPIEVTEGRSALTVENTLRGYIHLDKVVVGTDGSTVIREDLTEFTYDVELNNADAVFKGDSIPWYGISSLFYHDEDLNYYQADKRDNQLLLTTETGGPYLAECDGFDPDNTGAQTIVYTDTDDRDDEGRPRQKTVVIYGNQMTPSNGTEAAGYKKVSAILKISQEQTLNIANVPEGTSYTITEAADTGYTLVGIQSKVNHAPVENPSVNGNTITGTIVTNSDNQVIYTNKRVVADISIKKTDEGGEGLSGAVFQLLKKDNEVYRNITAGDGIEGLERITIDDKTYEFAFESDGGEHVLTRIPDGEYRLDEVHIPPGYINTTGSIYFKIANGKVTSTTADESEKVALTSKDGLVIGSLQVKNTPGAALPNTGGPGTDLTYLLGIMLTGLAGTGLVMKRRRRNVA